MKTRIAPTPSGLLHAGNAWSFLLTWLLARTQGGTVHLRIDDLDTARLREEYVEDIFASLQWLGLDWDTGPRTLAEVNARYSQRLRLDTYRAALEKLAAGKNGEEPLLYACACSRGTVKRDARLAGRPGVYAGTCRDSKIPWRAGFDHPHPAQESFPLRIRVPGNAQVTIEGMREGTETLFPGRDMGDFVVWQRNGEPAYQLASLVDDEEFAMDCIVRGQDLLPSTGAQMWLAERLGCRNFRAARFLHHALLLDAEGGKLSKSEGAVSLRALREKHAGPGPLLAFFARRLGLPCRHPATASELLAGFTPNRIPASPLAWADFCRAIGPP